jgi:DNA invertase Pin-like site-specific DNA recombinase
MGKTQPAVAFSYIRFSHPSQSVGDSLRRQTQAAADWCARHGVTLDTSTTLHDLGRSAFTGSHRQNPDRHALAGFLKLVENGKVPRGSYLVIENLDRLSREHIQPALLLALNLLQAGIRIVQLKPAEMVFDEKSDTMPVMMMMMELSRGHGESAMKSERLGSAWAEKKQDARENGTVHTAAVPAWVRVVGRRREGKHVRGGTLELIPERAAVVKRIFTLAASGYGNAMIVKKLTAEGVPPFGPSGHWSRAYVHLILRDRRAVGEYQPRRKRDDTPDGEPIPNYFPAVVSEDEWNAARAAAGGRRKQATGRTTKHIDLFAGLVRNARDGGGYYTATRCEKEGYTHRVLINGAAVEGRSRTWSFPALTFERAILSMLAEVNPHDVLNGDDGPDESLVLAGELAHVEAKVAELEAELSSGDVAALARELRRQEARQKDLAERLAVAKQKAAHPLSASWGEAQSLLSVLDNAADPLDARVRLRSAIKRIVDGIWVLIVAKGKDRLCAAQVWFAGGKRSRSYLILHKSAGNGRKESWEAHSFVPKGKAALDLRQRDHARLLEQQALLAASE